MTEPRKASLAVVVTGRHGNLIEVDRDVLDVAERIKTEVHPALGVQFNEDTQLFRVYELCADGKKRTVKWTPTLTPDLIPYLKKLGGTDYVKAMEAKDRQADRDKEQWLHEQVGPIGERLHHAIRKDKGFDKDRAFVPREI